MIVVDMEVVGGEEVEVGEETGVGEGSIRGSNSGKTETGTGGMEVGINQAPTRDTTLIIRDHIMTATDLRCNLSGVDSIYSVFITCIAIPYVAVYNS